MGTTDAAPIKVAPLEGLLIDLIMDDCREPARTALLALLVARGVLAFNATLQCLDHETFLRLSDAVTSAERRVEART